MILKGREGLKEHLEQDHYGVFKKDNYKCIQLTCKLTFFSKDLVENHY